MKELNASDPVFENLIKADNIYVDKTKYIYSMVKGKSTNYIFCSRPRRFGKTLTVSTLEALFNGKRELFKGLYIDSADYDWKEYPVIHIDLGGTAAENANQLKKDLKSDLNRIAKSYCIELDTDSEYYEVFKDLIKELSKKGKVVILVDEYDKMLSSNIDNPEVFAMRDVLRGFFEVIKASYEYIRFVFITGVTKYAKVSIFSSMNNLKDISMSKEYATMFGYTKAELLSYFDEYIDLGVKNSEMDRESYIAKLKSQYDGYKFYPDSETIYNPVSIGSFFSDGGMDFDNYWSDTGGMKLLMDISKKVDFHIAEDLGTPIRKIDISSFDILEMAGKDTNKTRLQALLFQTGYLTIKSAEDEFYTLDFPNGEVRESFSTRLLATYIGEDAESAYGPNRMQRLFREGNTLEAIEYIKTIYAAIPYGTGKTSQTEKSFQDGFFCMMKGAGAKIESEVYTNLGRIDTVLNTEKHIYVIEFKLNSTSEEALSQIREKRYYEKYDIPNRSYKIHLLGINFSTDLRNIENYREEII